MPEIPCEIVISSTDEIVTVEIRVRRNTTGEALRALIEAIANAFASADQDAKVGRVVETRGPTFQGPWLVFTINRRYQDTEFPRRLAAALHAIGLTDFQSSWLH